jgi:hypothetical protein
MALAGVGRYGLALPNPLAVTAGLLAATLLPPFAGPIPLGRLPPRPETRGARTRLTAIPRERMRRREPLLAALQQTNPRAGVGRALPQRRRTIILDMDQGSANSHRSSPGSGASTPLAGRFVSLTSCG